jgi:hypothetical protein
MVQQCINVVLQTQAMTVDGMREALLASGGDGW